MTENYDGLESEIESPSSSPRAKIGQKENSLGVSKYKEIYNEYTDPNNINPHGSKDKFTTQIMLAKVLIQQQIFEEQKYISEKIRDQQEGVAIDNRNYLMGYKDDLVKIRKKLEDLKVKKLPNFNTEYQETKETDQDQKQNLDEMLTIRRHLVETTQTLNFLIYNYSLAGSDKDEKDEELECDAYFFTSKVMDFLLVFTLCFLLYIPLSLAYIFYILLKHSKPEILSELKEMGKNYLTWIPTLFFTGLLMIPGMLVVLAQGFCLMMLAEENQETSKTYDSITQTMHYLFIVFYFFISMSEVSTTIKSIRYFYLTMTKTPRVKTGLVFLDLTRFIPQFVRILFCFWFFWITLILIDQIDTTTELIQNFAALAIMLEFDNWIMSFLRFMKFKSLYKAAFSALQVEKKKDLNKKSLDELTKVLEKNLEKEENDENFWQVEISRVDVLLTVLIQKKII